MHINYSIILLSKLLIEKNYTDLKMENDFSLRFMLVLKITQSSTRWYTPHILSLYLEGASGNSTIGEWIMRPISGLSELE